MTRIVWITPLLVSSMAIAQAVGGGGVPGAGSSATLPTATAAGQVLTSTAAGTTYTAQVPAMVLIQKQTLATGASSVTFSSIPQTYTHLKLLTSTVTSVGSGVVPIDLTFNGDSGVHYFYNIITNSFGTSVTGNSNSATETTFAIMGDAGDNNPSAASNEITVMNYTGTSFGKTMIGECSSTTQGVYHTAGIWAQTAAVSSITLSLGTGTFSTGSVFSLYGIN